MGSLLWVWNILRESLHLQAGEQLLVLADDVLAEAGMALEAGAAALGARALPLPPLLAGRSGLAVIDRRLLQLVREADVVVVLRSDLRLAAEDPLMRAALGAFRAEGRGRWATLAQIDQDVLDTELSADFLMLRYQVEQVASSFRRATGARLTGQGGTDLTLSFGGRPIQVESGRLATPGAMGNLPAGEVYVAPLEWSVNGRLVVDQALGDLDLDGPVTLRIEGGRVVEVAGGRAAVALKERLGEADDAWQVGEFGLGANPAVKLRGRVAIDEKALGTAHIALGGNIAFGGINPAPTHYDCVIAGAEVQWR